MSINLDKFLVREDVVIKEALKRLGEAGERILFVVDERSRLLGAITDGDIRRWILSEGSLLEQLARIYNRTPKYLIEGCSLSDAKKIMISDKIEALPIVDEEHRIIDVLLWSKVFSEELKPQKVKLNVPVLVMAGGRGARMDPFTRILPKPLIPLGDKPIIEIILDNFAAQGCGPFYLTVNYKGKMIQSYFDSAECDHDIRFFMEENPCGTAGGIRLVEKALTAQDIFISNCDILVKSDYSDIFKFHKDSDNDITMVGSMKHFAVPYGVLELKNGGVLASIIEKPEYDFLVNTGMYLIKRSVIDHIPMDTKFDFTELIAKVKDCGGKVGVYPIGQHSWIDVGQWQEYHNALKEFEK